MIIQGQRKDLLAEVVLGYSVAPIHLKMIRHQSSHMETLLLASRGFGKTTVCTIVDSIWQILVNPNIRILFASKTHNNSKDFLKEVKLQFETNERLREIFGDFVGQSRWDAESIEVRGRTSPAKEPTINTIGREGAIASKHYDIIYADDLVDEDNSRTKYQRDSTLAWYNKALMPCLMPADGSPQRGQLRVIGTRYHYEDLYHHLMNVASDGTGGEMAETTLIIPALNEEGESSWPEMINKEKLLDLKRKRGIIHFNSQYQCDCEAMKGQIFRYDDCDVLDDENIPTQLNTYMGVDLAISEAEQSDMFAIVVVGIDRHQHVFVQDYFEGRLRFPEQTQLIKDFAKRHNPTRIGIEVNAYQKAQYHQVKKDEPWLNIVPLTTIKDKVTRAWNLAPMFETGRVHFRRSHQHLIEHIVLFPGYRYKDLFDAFDLAIQASKKRVRKQRREEPGLI